MLCLATLFGIDTIWNEISLVRTVLDLSGFLTKIIPVTALALFCTLARLVTLHLRNIRTSIKENIPSVVSRLKSQRLNSLNIQRNRYLLTCKVIRQLEQCFGAYLTIEVCYIFVGVITSSWFVLMSVLSEDLILGVLSGVIFVDHMAHLYFITSSSDSITSEVTLPILLSLASINSCYADIDR